jgi:PAS domain S-box-containing protein
MNGMPHPELDEILGRGLFEQVPFNVAVIDREYRVAAANRNFEEFFGDWRGRRCHEVFKSSSSRCAHCQARATFEDGVVRVSDETGVDRHGRKCHYVVHMAPLRDAGGRVKYVMEMTTDLTETRHWQRQYDLFFERVPCYVTIIHRDFRIVRANEKFRQTFGEVRGRFCYEVYKRRKRPCSHCPAVLTFRDGSEHTFSQIGVQKEGKPAYYVVTTSPVSRGEEGIEHVIEMATDITPIHELEMKLQEAYDFYESLIRNAATGILAVDTSGHTRIMNPAARQLLAWKRKQPPEGQRLGQMLPEEFFLAKPHDSDVLEMADVPVRTARGEHVPVRFSAVELKSRGKSLGRGAFLQDLREIKRLEQEKLEAERLGAVGQTVAGLAHTIKNLLMGLEGGMYMVDSGLRRGDAARIVSGWEVLHRNFEKTTTLVRDFLSFAKGRLPDLRPVDPNVLARNIVDLYREAALRQGVELVLETGVEVKAAPLDPHGMETSLTNLISNGIDAAMMREEPGGKVILRTGEDGGELIFEVTDNGCGMDWEVKGKIFTTFFTTKGGKGTGLGLLTTRKIVQEHGGYIDMESSPGEGTTFRIRLPRKRLEALAEAASDANGSTDEANS